MFKEIFKILADISIPVAFETFSFLEKLKCRLIIWFITFSRQCCPIIHEMFVKRIFGKFIIWNDLVIS